MLKKSVVKAVLCIAVLLGSTGLRADVIQLGFLLDRSGSVGSSEWDVITDGLADAIDNLVPTDGTYEISVVSFGTDVTTVVDTVVLDGTTKAGVLSAITGATFSGGWTNMSDAFDTMTAVLGASSETVTASYVNLATDGRPMIGSPTGTIDLSADTIVARDAMIAAGIDNISIEAIGSGVDAAYLQDEICYPGPCDTTLPYAFPGQGFYIEVADASEYASVIGTKIQTVVPAPAGITLLGLGLIALGFGRTRQQA